MRILTIHNKYQIRGGEDESRESEDQLLRTAGHDVRELVFDNSIITGVSAAATGVLASWRQSSYRRVIAEIDSWHPDVVDIHNFFPLATPAVHYAARSRNVPVIQTLHNFRLLCPGASLFRNGSACEKCVGKVVPWPAIVHGCYRNDRAATAAVTSMVAAHNLLGTWKTQVSVFVTLTEFNRRKFIEGGLPADKIVVKQNFVPIDLGRGSGDGDYVLYVGRLSVEKGIQPLLDAWSQVKVGGRLLIAGDGPLQAAVQEKARSCPSIEYLGRTPLRQVYELMGRARALVFPSLWYEGMPRVVIESLCRGTPVIASRMGSMLEMLREGETGWFVEPGSAVSLAAAMEGALRGTTSGISMREAARAEFESKYTATKNLELMENIYRRAAASVSPKHWEADGEPEMRRI